MSGLSQSPRKLLKVTEAIGAVFIFFAGAALHFTFEWSGHNVFVGLFSAVNESVWEHLKLAYFPAVWLGLVQYALLRKHYPNFFAGKATGVFSVPVIIVVGFYGYQAIFRSHNLAYDIGLFVFSVVVGQFVSYKMVVKYGNRSPPQLLPVIALAAYAVAFFAFTFEPPRLEPFRDPITGEYGIHAALHHHHHSGH
ncbi:MAG: DUF6512 family protein [Thaumarchaeota archaeon]|nr:DUF6512 family protein [Candidatus Calditenuaceae archaeon]MCX8203567.1 DUF6512 family protein [Nitrososphaeria archaeon]MDW8043509.1 DUF6512 family protein [Nitrososphaerota archaeon]